MRSERKGWLRWAVALVLLAIPVAIFGRRDLFYTMDDWTSLMFMAQNSFWGYLVHKEAELWRPVSRLAYYCTIRTAGNHYTWLVLVNCLATGLNAWLLQLFLRRHFPPSWAVGLAIIYAGAMLHFETAWMSVNLCYLLALGFFLAALIITDNYFRCPSTGRLAWIGLFSYLSIHSHNLEILALAALPLYGLVLGEENRGRVWALAAVIAAVYLAFALEYFTFLGIQDAAHHNPRLFAELPGLSYLTYWAHSAFLFPTLYLVLPTRLYSPWAPGAAALALTLALALILGGGDRRERRLALWVLGLNGLPLLLLALARYQLPLVQAASPRYVIFTVMGILILLGLVWRRLEGLVPWPPWGKAVLLAVLVGAAAIGHFKCLQVARKQYVTVSAEARRCYQELETVKLAEVSPEWAKEPFCPPAHPWLTRGQALEIRRFLEGSGKP